jgi:hypothetical protein
MNSQDKSAMACTVEPRPALMGLAHLMTLAFQGVDLAPLAKTLIERASTDEADANALMDLSTILQLQGIRDVGLATQAQALKVQRLYELPASRTPASAPALRLLALMAPGDLMTNAPLPFLIDHSDIDLRMLYLPPGEPLPTVLPAHDLAFIAISESDPTHGLLCELAGVVDGWPKPVINRPDHITRTARSQAYTLLRDAPDVCMPMTARATRDSLLRLAGGQLGLGALLPDGVFPLIVRPVDSHAGHDLDKVDTPQALAHYLAATAGLEFFISRFVDYSGTDGLFRKYRVVLIDGVPYAGHMGISEHWMIHYLNAGMADSPLKRAEEQAFMDHFERDFASRHATALRSIAARFELPYLVIDCAETVQGELLVFEVDPSAVVHAMDPVDLFPYKVPAMHKVFTAFRDMLLHHSPRHSHTLP